jgi:hypothetical protein
MNRDRAWVLIFCLQVVILALQVANLVIAVTT